MPLLVPTLAHIGTAQGTYQGELLTVTPVTTNSFPATPAFINGGHVIMVTAAGAIQDRTPKGKHSCVSQLASPPVSGSRLTLFRISYDNVFYFVMAIKALDFLLGLFYIVLDRVALDSILTRSERAQAEHDLAVLAGEKQENVGSLRRPSTVWTCAGLSTGAAMTVAAWAVYLVYAQGS